MEAFHANLVNVLSKCAHEIGLAGFASQPFRFKSQASGPYTRLMGAVPMAYGLLVVWLNISRLGILDRSRPQLIQPGQNQIQQEHGLLLSSHLRL